jgi:hypothetical protein
MTVQWTQKTGHFNKDVRCLDFVTRCKVVTRERKDSGDAVGKEYKIMQSKEEASTFRNAPLAAWLAMVALVLIVISVALLLAAWRAQKKQTKAIVAAQITASFHRGMQKPLVPSMNSAPVRLGGRRTPEVRGWSA